MEDHPDTCYCDDCLEAAWEQEQWEDEQWELNQQEDMED